MDAIRPIIARLAGAIVGALAAWLVGHFHYSLDPATQSQLTDGFVALMTGVFGVVYAIVHKLVDSWVNPVDAATVALAAESKVTQATASRNRALSHRRK